MIEAIAGVLLLLFGIYQWMQAKYYKTIVNEKVKKESVHIVNKMMDEVKNENERTTLNDLIKRANARYSTKRDPSENN